jgi:hypothetical protein
MTVTFALSGLGEAFLDDVTVETIDRPAQATTARGAPTQSTASQSITRQAGKPPIDAAQASGPQARGPAGVRKR